MKRTFIIGKETYTRGMAYVQAVVSQLLTESTVAVDVYEVEPTRTIEQNAKLHAMLHDIAHQVEWVVDGVETKLNEEEWKDLLTAALNKEMRVAKGINGGVVLLGRSTRKMKVAEMSDLIELMYAFGAEHDVKWKGE